MSRFLIASATVLMASAPVVSGPALAEETLDLEIPFEKYTLDNGLEVILHQDNRVPLVAVNVWVHVGAFHEPDGRSGFAHLFEHLMFEGSAHAEHPITVLERLGATQINGTTSFDRTNYFQTVPSHHLETALWLESDRLGFLLPALTEENLEGQQEVVMNERRQVYDASPYGLARIEAFNALFPHPHPYNNMVIGSMEDIAAATMDDVRSFFDTWYAPANVTLTVAGDFEREEVEGLIEKYFGSLPARPRPERPDIPKARLEEKVVIHHDEPLGPLAQVMILWHSPAAFEPGDAEARVLAMLLSTGRSARLQRRLVFDKRIAQSVSSYQWGTGHQSIFGITATARPGTTTDELLAEIDAELDEIRKAGPADEELLRVVNRIETRSLSGLQRLGGFGGRADQLQYYNHHLGDPGYLAEDISRFRAVTSACVRAFVEETLCPERRVILHAVPTTEEEADKASPAAPDSQTAQEPKTGDEQAASKQPEAPAKEDDAKTDETEETSTSKDERLRTGTSASADQRGPSATIIPRHSKTPVEH